MQILAAFVRWGARFRRCRLQPRLSRMILTALAVGVTTWALLEPSGGSPLQTVSCTVQFRSYHQWDNNYRHFWE